MRQRALIGVLLAGAIVSAAAQSPPAGSFPVTMRVDASSSTVPLKPIWRFFGAEDPNYA